MAIPNAKATISNPAGADASGILPEDPSVITLACIASNHDTIETKIRTPVKLHAHERRVTRRIGGSAVPVAAIAFAEGPDTPGTSRNARRTALWETAPHGHSGRHPCGSFRPTIAPPARLDFVPDWCTHILLPMRSGWHRDFLEAGAEAVP
ncbi:MAG: hypothetical protein EXR45_02570 [Chloroflexi bacterium]|nr:hypothetical protein [Chloroflexota bacterium]